MSNPCILLVDDEPDLRDLLRDVLESENIDCLAAEDGFEALKILKERKEQNQQVHLILSDISMPNMGGFELLEKTKDLSLSSVFVFLSGHADHELEAQAKSKGAMGVLYKPFRAEKLIELVQSILNKKD